MTCIWYIKFLVGWTPSFSWLVVIVLIYFYIDFQDNWRRVGTNFGCNKTQAIYRPAERTTASQIGQWFTISVNLENVWEVIEARESTIGCVLPARGFASLAFVSNWTFAVFCVQVEECNFMTVGLIKKNWFTFVDKYARYLPRFIVARSVYCVGVPWRCVCCTCLSCLSCYDSAEGLQMRADKIFVTAVTSEPDSITQGFYTSLNSQSCVPQSSSTVCLFTNLIFNSVDFFGVLCITDYET
jgi:hypothetical protein